MIWGDIFSFRNADHCDFARICELEKDAYINGDQDSPEFIRFRIENAREYFRVFSKDKIIGYINGTVSKAENYKKELLNTHDPDGNVLCIHSVVMGKEYRGKGLGQKMFQAYLEYIIKNCKNIEKIILISKHALAISFYTQFGFRLVGERPDIVYGSGDWNEMELKIKM